MCVLCRTGRQGCIHGTHRQAKRNAAAIGWPHLIDPMWALRAAAQLDYRDVLMTPQHLGGMAQLAQDLKREAEAATALPVQALSFAASCLQS